MEVASGRAALAELVTALEQATQMAKQLPVTTDPSHIHLIYSTLNSAHLHLYSFLSHHPPPPSAAENSVPSAAGPSGDADTSPMLVGDDIDGDQNLKNSIENVEEQMRDCFVQNKRYKRQLSPSAEPPRLGEYGATPGTVGYDPHITKLRSLDLVFQFHG